MIRRPPRSTRTDTLFPTRRSSDLHGGEQVYAGAEHHRADDIQDHKGDELMMGLAFMLAGERPEFADDEAVHGGNGIADEARDPFVNAIALVQHEQYDKADTGVEYTGYAEAQELPGKHPITANRKRK